MLLSVTKVYYLKLNVCSEKYQLVPDRVLGKLSIQEIVSLALIVVVMGGVRGAARGLGALGSTEIQTFRTEFSRHVHTI